MGARQKINLAIANGILLVATVAGLALKSWLVFLVVAIVLIIGAIYIGDIRGGPRRG